MASVMQGDAYNIPVTIKSGNGTLITPEIAACVEITVGQFAKRWPGQVTFDEKTGEWKFPMTQNQTFRFTPGAAVVQARVVFQDGSIMGGSGAPMRVEQSASRGTLPQPEKTETTTGSTPKATEVKIPTVHDINVSLHSQVILSAPIKAPYIGDNGNWYEYDAATGEFVDTGVKAGGSADLSLGITAAQVGQIAKITAVDETGKPTKWEPVEIPSGGTDISLGLTAATVGQTIKVKAVDTDGKPTAWVAETSPVLIDLYSAGVNVVVARNGEYIPFDVSTDIVTQLVAAAKNGGALLKFEFVENDIHFPVQAYLVGSAIESTEAYQFSGKVVYGSAGINVFFVVQLQDSNTQISSRCTIDQLLLPIPEPSDDGAFLRAKNGEWVMAQVPIAEGGTF